MYKLNKVTKLQASCISAIHEAEWWAIRSGNFTSGQLRHQSQSWLVSELRAPYEPGMKIWLSSPKIWDSQYRSAGSVSSFLNSYFPNFITVKCSKRIVNLMKARKCAQRIPERNAQIRQKLFVWIPEQKMTLDRRYVIGKILLKFILKQYKSSYRLYYIWLWIIGLHKA